MDGIAMSTKNESKIAQIGSPLLFGLILTLIYGLTAYIAELLNLEHVLFAENLSAFETIFFKFLTRFTFSGILWIILIPFALYYMKGISSRDYVDSTRLHPDRISTRSILLGLIVSFTFVICIVLTAIFLGVYTSNFSLLVSPDYEDGLGWFIFVFALIPGIWEEIAFRGVILSFLMSKYPLRKALIFDGVLFSLFHIFNYLILGQELIDVLLQSLAAVAVGVALAYLVVKTGSLLPAIMIHYSIDVTLFISGFIFDLSDTSSALVFALLALIVLPPVLIFLFTYTFGDNRTSEITNSKILEDFP